MLQMPVHGPAEIEEQAPGNAPHDEFLDEVGGVVEADDREEGDDDVAQNLQARLAGDERLVDRVAQHEGNRDLGEGKDEHRGHSDPDARAVGSDEGPEAAHYPPVEGGAEHLLFEGDLRADHRAGRRTGRRSRLHRRLHEPASTSSAASPSLIRVCSA